MSYITIDQTNIDQEHICCAFSDKKCAESYALKKEWLKQAFGKGFVFRRINERAKVFIEYGPAETSWIPVTLLQRDGGTVTSRSWFVNIRRPPTS